MSTVSLTRLYDLLSEKVGKETAENLTEYIEGKIKNEIQESSKLLATKQDLYLVKDELKRDIALLKDESKQDLYLVKDELKRDIALLKDDIADSRENLANTKAELIKWMFIFWIGQVAVTFGFILLFLNK